jgi:hypothetical protein
MPFLAPRRRMAARFASAALLALGVCAGGVSLDLAAARPAHAQAADRWLFCIERANDDCFLTSDPTEVGPAMAYSDGMSSIKLGRLFSTPFGEYNRPIYRLARNGFHFYTVSEQEKNVSVADGWVLENVVGYAKAPGSILAPGDKTIYRYRSFTYGALNLRYTGTPRHAQWPPRREIVNDTYRSRAEPYSADLFPQGDYLFEGEAFIIRD